MHVSVSSLGYDGIAGYLVFRDDTAVFETANRGGNFVHGGNSPQERVIPVLTVTTKHIEASSLAEYAVEVEPQSDVLGLHRFRLRVVFSRGTTTSLGFAAARTIDLALRVPEREGIRIVIKDVTKPGVLRTGRVQVPVGDAWTEVYFGLEGPADERVRVEVHHPYTIEKVQSAQPEAWYAVSGTTRLKTPSTPPAGAPPPAAPLGWADAIPDEGIRKVFLHIEEHGRITEEEALAFLNTRAERRRFTLEFDLLLAKLPFKVTIQSAEGGKRYVREGDL